MRILLILLICQSSYQVFSQSKGARFVLDLQYENPQFVGDNVYHTAHSSWTGIGLKSGFILNNIVFVHAKYAVHNADIIDKSAISARKTKTKMCSIEVGYPIDLTAKWAAFPFISGQKIKGENQGEYYGKGLGIGTTVKYVVYKSICTHFSIEYQRHRFDIEGNASIISKYDQAKVLQLGIGIGVLLY